ncbi:MAG TPA: response regulator transcription factor [Dehalococcoidia bacterium]|nr:response regulator transcription factor [Dehalococcoidia bacterium]
MIKVLIADDHAIVREGLKQIVADVPDIDVAGEAKDGHEALDMISKNNYDVVLLDISMPGISGLDVLKQLRSQKPQLRVLILSIYPEEQYAVRTLKAGASGYLTKESAPDELVAAIRKVSQGGNYVSHSLGEKLATNLRLDANKQPHEALSDREFQVMRMIASGKKGKEIAEELLLSVKTVSTYRRRVLDKLGVKHNSALIRYAMQNHLLE